MKDKLITEILTSMAPLLTTAQLEELRQTLTHSFRSMEIAERKLSEPQEAVENNKLLDVFIGAKRIEGCSEKSLKYYETTVRTMLDGVNKPAREVNTDNLRGYSISV